MDIDLLLENFLQCKILINNDFPRSKIPTDKVLLPVNGGKRFLIPDTLYFFIEDCFYPVSSQPNL